MGSLFVSHDNCRLLVLFIAISRIDPLRENILSFREQYDSFVVLFTAFMLYVHSLVILWNLG